MENKAKNPAKFTDSIIETIGKDLVSREINRPHILDPFAGSGKIALLKNYIDCHITGNDLEEEWKENYDVDEWKHQDAEFLSSDIKYDLIITSPTYGNRMADHFNASKPQNRITYTHRLGHKLKEGNTGEMYFGEKYKEKHTAIFKHLLELLNDKGLVYINVSNFIKKGVEVDVVSWYREMMGDLGITLIDDIKVKTPRMRFGANSQARVEYEDILVFMK